MASGSLTTNTTTWYGEGYTIVTSFRLDWSSTPNVATNTSTINWTVTTVQTPTSSGYTRGVYKRYAIFNGQTTEATTHLTVYNGYQVLSGTETVYHDSDGRKSIGIGLGVAVGQNNTYTCTNTATITLDAIARASTVSAPSSYSIANTTDAMTYTVTSASNFYHKAEWALGGVTTSLTLGQINATTRSFTISNTDMLNKMPTATSAGLGIAIYTYSDSGYTNQIGATTASSTISINTGNIKPSVSLGNISINSTPISGYAVAGYSSLKEMYSTTNSYGASSVTTYFSISNGSLTSSSSTATSGMIYTNTLPQSTSDYTVTISAYAKDSRGATSSTVSKAFGAWGYQPPTATISAYRVADSTSTTEDGSGEYVYVTFGGTVGASVNGQNTIQSTTCTYSGSISGTATNGQHIALGDTQSVSFTVTTADKVTSSQAFKNVAVALYPLDLYDSGDGVVGVGLGTTAVPGYLKTPLSVRVQNGKSAGGYVSIYEDNEGGNIEIGSPNGKFFQIDSNNDTTLRCYSTDSNDNYIDCSFNRTNGQFKSRRLIAVSNSNSGYVEMWGDGEGGNIEVSSPNGKKFQIDAYNDNVLRCYSYTDGGVFQTCDFNRTTGVFYSSGGFYGDLNGNITGNASTATRSNGVYFSRTTSDVNGAITQNSMVVGEYYDQANLPTTSGYYHVISIQGPDVNYGTQIAIGLTVRGVYYRRYVGGSWTAWEGLL